MQNRPGLLPVTAMVGHALATGFESDAKLKAVPESIGARPESERESLIETAQQVIDDQRTANGRVGIHSPFPSVLSVRAELIGNGLDDLKTGETMDDMTVSADSAPESKSAGVLGMFRR